MQERLLFLAFRPRRSILWLTDKNYWMFDPELTHLMLQYETAYPNFRFIGCVMSDFAYPASAISRSSSSSSRSSTGATCADAYSNACTINIKDYKQFGLIVNLSRSTEQGSHWTGLFVDVPQGFIAYFDSYALGIPKDIVYFVNQMQAQAAQPDSGVPHGRFMMFVNKTAYQAVDADCGVYAAHFIIRLVQGEHPKDVFATPKEAWNDAIMSHFRHNVYFSPAPPATQRDIDDLYVRVDPDLADYRQKHNIPEDPSMHVTEMRNQFHRLVSGGGKSKLSKHKLQRRMIPIRRRSSSLYPIRRTLLLSTSQQAGRKRVKK